MIEDHEGRDGPPALPPRATGRWVAAWWARPGGDDRWPMSQPGRWIWRCLVGLDRPPLEEATASGALFGHRLAGLVSGA